MATCLIIGDSIFADIDFDSAVESLTTFSVVGNQAIGGYNLSGIEGLYDYYSGGYDVVITNGGINDIIYAASDPNTVMRTAMQSIIDDSIVDGIELIVTNITPFGGYIAWTADRQAWLESYNAWLASYCSASGIQLNDAYTTLKDPGSYALDAAYFDGDYVHPNPAGSQAIAGGIDFGEYAYIPTNATSSTILPIKFDHNILIPNKDIYRSKFYNFPSARFGLFDIEQQSTLLPTTIAPTTQAPTTIVTTLAPTTLPPTEPPTEPPTTVVTTLAPTTLAPTIPPTTLGPTTPASTLPPTTLGPTTAYIPPEVLRRGKHNNGFSLRNEWR